MIGKVYRTFVGDANTMWSLFQHTGKGNYTGILNAISENIKYAYYDLIQRIKNHYGFSIIDAYHLLSQVGEVRVCQVLGDHQAALAKVNRTDLRDAPKIISF